MYSNNIVTVSRLNEHTMTKSGWLAVTRARCVISPDSSLTRHLRSPHMKQRHRNRFSLTHLSTETTATLPEYAPAATSVAWQHQPPVRVQQHRTPRMFPDFEGTPSDRPPDYPDSADEADEEADSGAGEGTVFGDTLLPSHPGASAAATPSPRRHFKRYASSTSPGRYPNYCHPHYARHNPNHHAQRPHLPNRRYKSSVALAAPDNDPYLDSLLARSVHALEMSNTLLQSSISTQTSLSELLQSPVVETGNSKPFTRDVDGVDQLEERTKGLSKKIDVYGERKDRWMDDLETIRRDVERLFGDGDGSLHASAQCAVSSSVPTSSSMPARCAYKRRPSQLELQDSDDRQAARLTYSPQERSRLVAPTPCAVTQYVVASSTDPDSIIMQSTLGTPSPQLRPLESTPRAYNMLASFVQPPPPTSSASTPSSVSSPSVLASLMPKMRRRSNSSTATIPGRDAVGSFDDHLRFEPAFPGATADGFRGRTPRSPLLVRPMTPPTEESAGSSSSSESLIAKQTVMSLRRILDEQAAKSETALNASTAHGHRPLRAPVFLPVTPAVPVAGTSNTTASISRLFTKAIHSSSTRPPSPPKHSSLKNARGSRGMLSASAHQPEASTSSARIDAIGATNNLLSVNAAKAQLSMLPELVSAGISKAFGVRANGSGSATSSGQSTPKRISFAELPEGSRAEGRSSRFKERQAQKRRRKQRNVTVLSGEDPLDEAWEADSESAAGGGWWSGWLGGGTAEAGSALAGMGGSSVGMYMSQHYEDRMESRLSRSWGSLGRLATAPGGLDEWTV